MPDNQKDFVPFPQVELALGQANDFVRHIQKGLNIVENGVFDFLTMCNVVVHKFQHGLDHNDPTVDKATWNSIVNGGANAQATPTPAPPTPAATTPAAVLTTPAATPVPAAAIAPTPAPTPAPPNEPFTTNGVVEDGVNAAEQAATGGETTGANPFTTPTVAPTDTTEPDRNV